MNLSTVQKGALHAYAKSTTTIQYPLDNDIMFALVMNDAELCRGLLERIFPGRKIRMLKVCDGSDVEVQNTIITGMISKSVRLDVLFEDDDSYTVLKCSV